MTKQQKTLWHMHSDVLKGFYQSDVFVVAEDLESAVAAAMQGYDAWLEHRLLDMGLHPLIRDSFPDDDDHASEKAAKRVEFEIEARGKMEAMEHCFKIMVHS